MSNCLKLVLHFLCDLHTRWRVASQRSECQNVKCLRSRQIYRSLWLLDWRLELVGILPRTMPFRRRRTCRFHCCRAWNIRRRGSAPRPYRKKPTSPIDFFTDVKPVFVTHCFSCHGPETHKMYGLDNQQTEYFGRKCLLAEAIGGARRTLCATILRRRHTATLLGRPFRFEAQSRRTLPETDRPIYGSLTDLKQRGLLDSTLVIWGGESADYHQPGTIGRDHGPKGFTMWLAGGGVKGGLIRAPPMSSDTPQWNIAGRFLICTPRVCTYSAWTTSNSPSATAAATSG